MVAKEAIRTSKQPGTKAETTSRQAVAMREDHKEHSVMTKKGERDRQEVETSEHATAEVMRKVRQLK